MRTLLALALALAATAAWADSVELVWDPAVGATSYDIQRATAPTGPWTTIASPPGSVCTGTPSTCVYTDATAPASGFVYYRLTPKNAQGSTPLTRQGVWYCGDCPGPPQVPKSVGVGF